MSFYRTKRGKGAQTPPPCLALLSPAAKTTAKLFPMSIQKGADVFRLPVLLRLILGLENTPPCPAVPRTRMMQRS
jgi:hypothetical protein